MEKIFTAKTIDEAKKLALIELGLTEDDISVEILEQPQKKLFGGFKGEAKIKVKYELDEEDDIQIEEESIVAEEEVKADSAPREEISIESSEKVRLASEYISNVIRALGVTDFEIKVYKGEDDTIVLDIVGDKLGVVIGRRGETLDSLQYLAILASNKNDEPYLRVSVDCNGYREKRKETLESLAKRTSAKVLKQCRRVTLEPMNPYERRVIHSAVAQIEGVTSHSTGDEPYRRVVISSIAKPQRSSGDRNDRGRRNNGGNRNYKGGSNYKSSSSFSTSFEREYKREQTESTGTAGEFSKETVELEKGAKLYGKIEL